MSYRELSDREAIDVCNDIIIPFDDLALILNKEVEMIELLKETGMEHKEVIQHFGTKIDELNEIFQKYQKIDPNPKTPSELLEIVSSVKSEIRSFGKNWKIYKDSFCDKCDYFKQASEEIKRVSKSLIDLTHKVGENELYKYFRRILNGDIRHENSDDLMRSIDMFEVNKEFRKKYS